MAKVDWITWNTDPKEIINPEKRMEKISEIYQDFSNYIHTNIYEVIKQEIQQGGLDKISLNLFGFSPTNEKATSIINRMDEISITYDRLSQNIKKSLIDQKETEKKELIESITEKIAEEQKILENTELLKNRLSSDNNMITKEEIDDIINTCHDKIKRLKEKLEQAKAI
jgi:hypothetical protein